MTGSMFGMVFISAGSTLLVAAGFGHMLQPTGLEAHINSILSRDLQVARYFARAWGILEISLGAVALLTVSLWPTGPWTTGVIIAVSLLYTAFTVQLVWQKNREPNAQCACTGHLTPINNWTVGRSGILAVATFSGSRVFQTEYAYGAWTIFLLVLPGAALALILWHLPAATIVPRTIDSTLARNL